MGLDYLTTKMQESLEVPSHGKPNAHTSPQPDMMWRTNAVEEEQLTHCQRISMHQLATSGKAHQKTVTATWMITSSSQTK